MIENIKTPTPEEIASWRKMSLQLMFRVWPMWLVYLLGNMVLAAFMFTVNGTAPFSNLLWASFSVAVMIPMLQVSVFITVHSDLQFSFKEGWQVFSRLFTFKKLANSFGMYFVICVVILDSLVWKSNPINEYSKEFINPHTGIIMKFMAIGFFLSNALLVNAISSLGSIFMVADNFLCSFYELDFTTRRPLLRKVRDICDKNFKLGWAPVLTSFLMLAIPIVGILFLPYLMTWKYVALREIVFGGGNKVQDKVTVTTTAADQVFGTTS